MQKQDYLLYLKSISLFDGVPNDLFKRIVLASRFLTKLPSEKSTFANTRTLVTVLTGSLSVYVKESNDTHYRIGTLSKSDSFVPAVFLTDSQNANKSIWLHADEKTTYMEVPLLLITTLADRHPVLQRNLMKSFCKNLHRTYDQLVHLMSR